MTERHAETAPDAAEPPPVTPAHGLPVKRRATAAIAPLSRSVPDRSDRSGAHDRGGRQPRRRLVECRARRRARAHRVPGEAPAGGDPSGR